MSKAGSSAPDGAPKSKPSRESLDPAPETAAIPPTPILKGPPVPGAPDPSLAEGGKQSKGTSSKASPDGGGTVETTGRRSVFRSIRRQLTDEELGQTGSQKLILDGLERAENNCEEYKVYVDKYHAAEKERCILHERLKHRALMNDLCDLAYVTGSILLGLSAGLFERIPDKWVGGALGVLGLLLVGGAFFTKRAKR